MEAGDILGTFHDCKPHLKTVAIKIVRYWGENRHTDKWNRIKPAGEGGNYKYIVSVV